MDSAWLFLLVNICTFLLILRLFLRRSVVPQVANASPSWLNFLAARVARDRHDYFTGQSNVTIVCLTGGPCAGKSSVIAKLMAHAQVHNIRVYYHPDTQSLIKSGGFLSELRVMSKSQQLTYVQTILRLQIWNENMFFNLAKMSSKKALIIVERGLLDYKLMLEPELWEGLLNENGWKEADLSDSRYHLVMHLETAATGAEEIFNKWNEGTWTLASAREHDSKLKDVWIKHHSFRALRNMKGLQGFEHKMEEAVKDILIYTNPASVRSCKRKFLVECDDPKLWVKENYAQDKIETTYLQPSASDQEFEKVEARVGKDGDSIFMRKLSFKPDEQSKEITKNRSVLTPREYLFCLNRAINKEKVVKTRYSFLYKNHHYALTKYQGKREWIMLVLTYSKDDAVHVPAFVRLLGMLPEKSRLDLSFLHDEVQEQPAVVVGEPLSPESKPAEEVKQQFEDMKLTKIKEDSEPKTSQIAPEAQKSHKEDEKTHTEAEKPHIEAEKPQEDPQPSSEVTPS